MSRLLDFLARFEFLGGLWLPAMAGFSLSVILLLLIVLFGRL